MRFLELNKIHDWEMIKEYKIISGEVKYISVVPCVFQPKYQESINIIRGAQSKTKGKKELVKTGNSVIGLAVEPGC